MGVCVVSNFVSRGGNFARDFGQTAYVHSALEESRFDAVSPQQIEQPRR
jgi:hypothetical protein